LSYPGTIYEIKREWPQATLVAPDDVPPNVARFYEQGLENLAQKRWDAAGAMFRKSLDVASKIIAADSKHLTLFARINKLHESGLITEAMKDWSHEIRLEGNNAVHDEEPESAEDAEATHKFTEAFLTYVFTLPAMVTANRARRRPDPSSSEA